MCTLDILYESIDELTPIDSISVYITEDSKSKAWITALGAKIKYYQKACPEFEKYLKAADDARQLLTIAEESLPKKSIMDKISEAVLKVADDACSVGIAITTGAGGAGAVAAAATGAPALAVLSLLLTIILALIQLFVKKAIKDKQVTYEMKTKAVTIKKLERLLKIELTNTSLRRKIMNCIDKLNNADTKIKKLRDERDKEIKTTKVVKETAFDFNLFE